VEFSAVQRHFANSVPVTTADQCNQGGVTKDGSLRPRCWTLATDPQRLMAACCGETVEGG
jgi:hypothetical protein